MSMDAVKFLEERKRMCHFYGDDSCGGCPLYSELGFLSAYNFRDYFPKRQLISLKNGRRSTQGKQGRMIFLKSSLMRKN